ncbi:MAG: inorganic pyrophosphatase [Chloroflexi bacterium]|nr:MAG: inorganic pyrophosphatase [Chloroflexota bacterium]
MKPDTSFWQAMNALIVTNLIVIDRPKGSSHPRYPAVVYPLDYGYLENTTASDGSGIDVWLGSLNPTDKILTGILCTFDTLKRDAEMKLLIGCTAGDLQIIQDFHNPLMPALYIPNPMVEDDLSK